MIQKTALVVLKGAEGSISMNVIKLSLIICLILLFLIGCNQAAEDPTIEEPPSSTESIVNNGKASVSDSEGIVSKQTTESD